LERFHQQSYVVADIFHVKRLSYDAGYDLGPGEDWTIPIMWG
jgi:hypothetical protein